MQPHVPQSTQPVERSRRDLLQLVIVQVNGLQQRLQPGERARGHGAQAQSLQEDGAHAQWAQRAVVQARDARLVTHAQCCVRHVGRPEVGHAQARAQPLAEQVSDVRVLVAAVTPGVGGGTRPVAGDCDGQEEREKEEGPHRTTLTSAPH